MKPTLWKVLNKVHVQKKVRTQKRLDSKYHGPYLIAKLLDKNNANLKNSDVTLFQKHLAKIELAYN